MVESRDTLMRQGDKEKEREERKGARDEQRETERPA